MASVHDGAVFDEFQDEDDEPSSSDNDPEEENDDALNANEHVLNDDDEDEEDDELLLEEDNINSPSSLPQLISNSADSIPAAVPLAVSSSTAVTIAVVPTAESPPDTKRQRVDSVEKKTTPSPLHLDDSRRLFQRLWTDEDEIELLQGFLNYITLKTTNSNNPASASHHYDTAMFYDQMKSKFQLDFNKNQLVEKLRRLKKKYTNVMSKISSGKDFSFKSPHDQFTFEISRKIWSDSVIKVEESVLECDENNNNNKINLMIDDTPKSTAATKKRSRNIGVKTEKRVLNDGFLITNSNNDNGNVEGFSGGGGGGGGGVNVAAGIVEETVKSCLTPLFKELLGSLMGGGGGYGGRGINGLAMNAMPLSFGGSLNFGGGGGNGELMDERWRKLQILELEVYSKRLELVQDQIKAALEELRSMNG